MNWPGRASGLSSFVHAAILYRTHSQPCKHLSPFIGPVRSAISIRLILSASKVASDSADHRLRLLKLSHIRGLSPAHAHQSCLPRTSAALRALRCVPVDSAVLISLASALHASACCQASPALRRMHPSRQPNTMLSVGLPSLCDLPRFRSWPPPCLLRLFFSASAKVKEKTNPRKRDRRKSS